MNRRQFLSIGVAGATANVVGWSAKAIQDEQPEDDWLSLSPGAQRARAAARSTEAANACTSPAEDCIVGAALVAVSVAAGDHVGRVKGLVRTQDAPLHGLVGGATGFGVALAAQGYRQTQALKEARDPLAHAMSLVKGLVPALRQAENAIAKGAHFNDVAIRRALKYTYELLGHVPPTAIPSYGAFSVLTRKIQALVSGS